MSASELARGVYERLFTALNTVYSQVTPCGSNRKCKVSVNPAAAQKVVRPPQSSTQYRQSTYQSTNQPINKSIINQSNKQQTTKEKHKQASKQKTREIYICLYIYVHICFICICITVHVPSDHPLTPPPSNLNLLRAQHRGNLLTLCYSSHGFRASS